MIALSLIAAPSVHAKENIANLSEARETIQGCLRSFEDHIQNNFAKVSEQLLVTTREEQNLQRALKEQFL